MSIMNRRKFLTALTGSLVALPTLASAKLYDSNPCKEVIPSLSRAPYKNAPLMVIPKEFASRLREYQLAYGDEFWVITEGTPVNRYQAKGVVFFGIAGFPATRLVKVYAMYAGQCMPGYKTEIW